MKTLAENLGFKKWKSLKKGDLCKKIAEHLKKNLKNSTKIVAEDKSNTTKKTKKTKKVAFQKKKNITEINYLPKKYFNTNYEKYKLDSDPIKEYCSQSVFPKFNYEKEGTLHQLLDKNNLKEFENNIKEGKYIKNISDDNLAELEICKSYLE